MQNLTILYILQFLTDTIGDFRRLDSPDENTYESRTWKILRENMQELKDLLSLETKFRVKHRLFQKVSFVMSNPLSDISHTPPTEKKTSNVIPDLPPGRTLRHSISEPANEKLFTEAAVASAANSGKIGVLF